MQYEIEADRNVIVTGLGTFTPGEKKSFTEEDAAKFEWVRGLKLNQGNMPEGATLTVISGEVE